MQTYERHVRCACGRELIHKAQVRLWTEVFDPNYEQSRPWTSAVPVSPISPPDHSSAEEASTSGYGHHESAWTEHTENSADKRRRSDEHSYNAPPQTDTVAETSGWRLREQNWEIAAQDTGAWDSWREPKPSSSAHGGQRNYLREVIEDHELPPKMFVPVFTPETMQECLERYRGSNKKEKDKLRRCDQCHEWPKQTSVGTPVVLCKACWIHLQATNEKVYREFVSMNDEFNQAPE